MRGAFAVGAPSEAVLVSSGAGRGAALRRLVAQQIGDTGGVEFRFGRGLVAGFRLGRRLVGFAVGGLIAAARAFSVGLLAARRSLATSSTFRRGSSFALRLRPALGWPAAVFAFGLRLLGLGSGCSALLGLLLGLRTRGGLGLTTSASSGSSLSGGVGAGLAARLWRLGLGRLGLGRLRLGGLGFGGSGFGGVGAEGGSGSAAERRRAWAAAAPRACPPAPPPRLQRRRRGGNVLLRLGERRQRLGLVRARRSCRRAATGLISLAVFSPFIT